MVAIIYRTGIKCACNHDNNGVLLCLQSQIRNGPYMLAIFSNKDKMLAIIKILFSRYTSRNHSHVTLGRFPILQAYLVTFEKDCKHIWSVSDLRLQPYLAPFFIEIASIFSPLFIEIANILGPHFNHDCKHIWSLP